MLDRLRRRSRTGRTDLPLAGIANVIQVRFMQGTRVGQPPAEWKEKIEFHPDTVIVTRDGVIDPAWGVGPGTLIKIPALYHRLVPIGPRTWVTMCGAEAIASIDNARPRPGICPRCKAAPFPALKPRPPATDIPAEPLTSRAPVFGRTDAPSVILNMLYRCAAGHDLRGAPLTPRVALSTPDGEFVFTHRSRLWAHGPRAQPWSSVTCPDCAHGVFQFLGSPGPDPIATKVLGWLFGLD